MIQTVQDLSDRLSVAILITCSQYWIVSNIAGNILQDSFMETQYWIVSWVLNIDNLEQKRRCSSCRLSGLALIGQNMSALQPSTESIQEYSCRSLNFGLIIKCHKKELPLFFLSNFKRTFLFHLPRRCRDGSGACVEKQHLFI